MSMEVLREKVKLAEELGLHQWFSEYKHQLDVKEEISKMTHLKFKPITMGQIEQKLAKRYWDWSIAPIPLFVKARIQEMPIENWEDNLPLGAFHAMKEAKAAGLGAFRIFFPVTSTRDRLMKDPIITGQLIKKQQVQVRGRPSFLSTSIAEAARAMMLNLNTHVEERIWKGKALYEIHAWDDGKVYD